jgi:branched-chain amino acid transport system permease protein
MANAFERLDEKTKTLVVGAGLAVVTFLAVFVLLGQHIDSFLQSIFQAIAAGVTAVALVLLYRTVRVINFAQISMGIIAAQLFYELYTRHILPYPFAIIVGLAGGTLVGLLIGVIAATLFFKHPRLVMTVVTIFFTYLVAYIHDQVQQAFVKPGEIQHTEAIIGPFPKAALRIGVVPFRTAHLISLLLLIGLVGGLVVFFRRTRVGTAIRASAENADRASLLGINVKVLQIGVWALVGFIASMSALAILPVQQYSRDTGLDLAPLLLPLCAAVVARMDSMPKAFFAGVAMMLTQQAATSSSQTAETFVDIGLFAVVMISLLLQRKKIKVRADEGTSWKAVKEVRGTPREMLGMRAISRTRIAIFVITAAVVLALPWMMGLQTVDIFMRMWITALVAVSLVILTGWTGQISLGQYAIVAVGAFVGGYMTLHWHVPFPFTLIGGGLAAAMFALLIGIPALRIRGLFLAVTTFAIAIVMPLFMYDDRFLGKLVPKEGIGRPKFLFLDFTNARYMYYLSLFVFVVVVAAVGALRRSRGGRVLIALRDNEAGVQSFGVDVVRTRLTAFAISGFIAGLAGALLVSQGRGMGPDPGPFSLQQSIIVFIAAVIGGVSSVLGAALGALYLTIGTQLFPGLQQIVTGVLGLMVMMAIPGGLTQVVFGFRDAILRVIAMRQHIVVPSLFADYSPEAWEKRLAPLAPAVQSQGLATLKPDQRYTLPSKVFGKSSA